MIPRNTHRGESLTTPSAIESNPAAWVEYSTLTREQRQLEALARALSIIEAGRPNWHTRAACRGSSVDFTSKRQTERAAAFALCGICEVRRECLAWAIDEVGDDLAILGGCDGAARRPLIRERQRHIAEQRQADDHEPDEQENTT